MLKKFADEIMKLVKRCVTSKSPRHRKFHEFLDENDAEMTDVPQMQQIPWFSCEKVFRQFYTIRTEIFNFIQQECPECEISLI